MEEKARSVDEKLRGLLKWGLATPGGKGRTVVPESFLTHVLLADQAQDSVRKILFEPKLDKDADESGRERLVAALGALAQDPLFKIILDQATESMQRAFTPKGQWKRSAASPKLEIIDRIKLLQAKKDQLEAQVKETTLVEARIKDLGVRHDSVAAALIEADEAHRIAVRQLEARRQRDVLHGEVQSLHQRIQDAELTAKQIDVASGGVKKLESDVAAARESAKHTVTRATQLETELNALRRQLDTALHDDPAAERRMAELQAEVTRTESRVRDALAGVSAAKDALLTSSKLAAELAAEDAAARKASASADAAAAAAADAFRDVERARRVLATAQDRQRDARSQDRAQARELRRRELENQGLSLASKRSQVEATLQRAQQVGQMSAQQVNAEAALQALHAKLTAARDEVTAGEAAHAKLQTARTMVMQLRAYGRFCQLRDELSKRVQASENADRLRRRAAELRERAADLRAEVRADLPTTEQIHELDGLRQQLRIAEAALGGGLSVEVRPKRSLTVQFTRDGETDRAVSGSEPLTLTAKRSITLAIAELLDVEITAGEEAARRAAADLRARWLREGESVLATHGFAALEELRLARARSDAALGDIADALREAENADQRASIIGDVDIASLREQLGAAEGELGAADREELAVGFARLGASWQTRLRTQLAEVEPRLESSRAKLEQKRAGVAKLEAQLDLQQREAARFKADVERAQAELTEPWATVVATCKADQDSLATAQQDIERQIAVLGAGASDEEAAADVAVNAAATALQIAEANAQAKQDAAQTTRAAQVRTSTRLDGIRATARQFDVQGVWAARLDGGDAKLPVDAWNVAAKGAEDQLDKARAMLAHATSAVTEAQAVRDSVIQSLRRRVQDAEDASRKARNHGDAAEARHKGLIAQHAAAVVSLSEMRVKLAGINLDELRAEIAKRRTRMAELEPEMGRVGEADVAALEQRIGRLRADLRELDEELAKARGALEQVGGAVVRERLAGIGEAIQQAEQREHEVEVEYEAWRLLHDTLRESETTESAHLGRALAGPLGTWFRQLTGGRYGDIELGAQLEVGHIHVAGGPRDVAALSAGTQDQLATLLRVRIAQQLRSAIILDDHLTQSDPARVAWFNTLLREAAENVQIILITCRPHEVLAADELCGPGQMRRASADERVHAVNLAAVIRRFDVPRPTPPARRTRELEGV